MARYIRKTDKYEFLKEAGWERHDRTNKLPWVWTMDGLYYMSSRGRGIKEYNMEQALILEGYFCKHCTDKYWKQKGDH